MATIFVNPLQFNDLDDYQKYPNSIEQDLRMLEKAGCDAVFAPNRNELLPEEPLTSFHFGALEQRLEGLFRPGHFQGVGTIVSKLLNITQPTRAYFGLKDLQQYLIVKRLVKDLAFPVEIIGVQTARESSGLAMSSRNLRLSEAGKDTATKIYQGLKRAEKLFLDKRTYKSIEMELREFYSKVEGLELEYFDIVDTERMETLNADQQYSEVAFCVAAYVEGIRLIDNLYLRLN